MEEKIIEIQYKMILTKFIFPYHKESVIKELVMDIKRAKEQVNCDKKVKVKKI